MKIKEYKIINLRQLKINNLFESGILIASFSLKNIVFQFKVIFQKGLRYSIIFVKVIFVIGLVRFSIL